MLKKIAVVLVFVLAIGGYFIWNHCVYSVDQENSKYLTFYGNVEIRRVNLAFRVSGRIEKIYFDEGDTVKKNEPIALLDREPYEDHCSAAEAQVAIAEANLVKLHAGNRPQEIEQARLTLNERIASLKVLESDLDRFQQLIKSGTITEQEFETMNARRDEADARRKLAEENLNLLIEGFRKEDIAIGQAQLNAAKAQLKKTETDLADTVLHCPNDGILLTRIEEAGSVIQAGQVIATLSLKDAVWVYVYVPEYKLGKTFPGMQAEILTDSRPDQPYHGQVGYISPQAEFTPKNVETKELRTSLVYRVRVLAEDTDNGLRQGMPVTVRLKLKDG